MSLGSLYAFSTRNAGDGSYQVPVIDSIYEFFPAAPVVVSALIEDEEVGCVLRFRESLNANTYILQKLDVNDWDTVATFDNIEAILTFVEGTEQTWILPDAVEGEFYRLRAMRQQGGPDLTSDPSPVFTPQLAE